MKYAARGWVLMLMAGLLLAAGCGEQGGAKLFSLDGDHGDLPDTGRSP
jgi:hypothetical protein